MDRPTKNPRPAGEGMVTSEMVKLFSRIKQIEDCDWNTASSSTSQSQSLSALLSFLCTNIYSVVFLHGTSVTCLLTSVEDFLKQLQLGNYWNTFRENRFNMLDTLKDLTESALND